MAFTPPLRLTTDTRPSWVEASCGCQCVRVCGQGAIEMLDLIWDMGVGGPAEYGRDS
jgi:hypothetical protein